MKKFLPALILISFGAILVTPMAVQAEEIPACFFTACEGAAAVPCKCGGQTLVIGQYCWAAGDEGRGMGFSGETAEIAKAQCQVAMNRQTQTTQGPLEFCTMSRDVGVAGCPISGECNFTTTPQCGICCLLQVLYNVTKWIFIILVAVAVLFVIMGALQFMMSAGEPEKTKKGRDYILWAMIGLGAAMLARAIPAIVKLVVGT